MVWSAAAAQRPSPGTTLLVLPPLPVPLIAEQWDEQLPAATAVPHIEDLDDDDEDEDEEGHPDGDHPNEVVLEEAIKEEPGDESSAAPSRGSPPPSGAKRKREESATAEQHERPAPRNLGPSRHPKPILPVDELHPYNQPLHLTSSHLAPEVLATAKALAARQGIKLDIPPDDTALDVRAYNEALVDPATVGSGAVAQARASSARNRLNGSMDGLSTLGEGLGTSASPAPGGTPGPSGAQTPTTASPSLNVRSSAGGRNNKKGQGRWGHLYAKRAQQAAAAKAEKERSHLAAATTVIEEAKTAAEAAPVTPANPDATAPAVTAEELALQKEKEERERVEQAEAARQAAEEKRREAMAKALGSASYWNHLLIEARRQRGPQWDVNTQLYQVDRGSALYYSDVRGPPPTPPPVQPDLPEPPKAPVTPANAAAPLPVVNGIDVSMQPEPRAAMPPPPGGQNAHYQAMMLQQQQMLRQRQQMQQQQQENAGSPQTTLQPQHSGPYQQPQQGSQQGTPRQHLQRLGSVPGDQQSARAMSGTPGPEHGAQARPQSAGRQGSNPLSFMPPQQQSQPSTPAHLQQQQYQMMMQGLQSSNAGTPTPMRPPSAMNGAPMQSPAAGQYSQLQLAQIHRQLQEQSMTPQQLQQMQQLQYQQMQQVQQQKQQMQSADSPKPPQQPGMSAGQQQVTFQGFQGQNAQQMQAQMALKQREMLQARMMGMPTNQIQALQAQQIQKQAAQSSMSVGLNGNAGFPSMPQGMSPQHMAAFQANQSIFNGMGSPAQQSPSGMMTGGKMAGNNGQPPLTPQQMQQMYAAHMAQQAANQGR